MLSITEKISELGYDIIINKTEKDQYHLIIGQANTFYIAQKLAKKLEKKVFRFGLINVIVVNYLRRNTLNKGELTSKL